MPAPDPDRLWIEEAYPGRVLISRVTPWGGCPKAGKRRALLLLRACQIGRLNGCVFCREPIPDHKRADARYCSRSCKARALQMRKADWKRGIWSV